MTTLPIVRRELRVSSRRKVIFYVRAAGALLASAMGFFLLLFSYLAGPSVAGATILSGLSWYAFLLAILAGLFLAADSLSEERREGTLGLLFLTDLRGYDVVFGKFVAVSLNAFYGLLAVFPIMAISLLAGGVENAEFWRVCLALLNVLFVSISFCMFVSSGSRSSSKAMGVSIAVMVCWILASKIIQLTGRDRFNCISPFEAFFICRQADYFRLAREYWISLAGSHLIGWLLLFLAGWRLRRFADKHKEEAKSQNIFTKDLLKGDTVRRARSLEINPILWLLDDSRRVRGVVWALSAIGVVILSIASQFAAGGPIFFAGWLLWPIYFLLKLMFAVQSCRFFSEARRTGALELLFCTPLTMRSVIRGQEMALRRIYLWPVAILLGVHLIILLTSMGQALSFFPKGGFPGILLIFQEYKVIVNNVADFFALMWFGMWMGLTQRPNMATGLTILLVLIVPIALVCIPQFITDAIFITIGLVKLSEDFRLRGAEFLPAKPVSSM